MKNKLICVGFMSEYHAFLNVPREEAIKRYYEYYYNDISWEPKIIELEFDDRFIVYDAWSYEG